MLFRSNYKKNQIEYDQENVDKSSPRKYRDKTIFRRSLIKIPTNEPTITKKSNTIIELNFMVIVLVL